MKGTTIAAMILAAAAASAATIVALKKAHDRRQLRELEEEDLYDVTCCDPADNYDDEVASEATPESEPATEPEDAPSAPAMTCQDGVCSIDLGTDDAADQPVSVQLDPEEDD